MIKMKKLAAVAAAAIMAVSTMAVEASAEGFDKANGTSPYGNFTGTTTITGTSGRTVTVENRMPSLTIVPEIGLNVVIRMEETGEIVYANSPFNYNNWYVGLQASSASTNRNVSVNSIYLVGNGAGSYWKASNSNVTG